MKTEKMYQLSKINGVYWWTGVAMLAEVPQENEEYKWTSDVSVAKELNGKRI